MFVVEANPELTMSIESYIEAKTAMERHEAELAKLAEHYLRLGAALKNQPGRMIFANTSAGLPLEASMSRDSVSLDANDFRTPAQMQEMLGQWHKLNDAMMNAWSALGSAAQANVSPPRQRGYRR